MRAVKSENGTKSMQATLYEVNYAYFGDFQLEAFVATLMEERTMIRNVLDFTSLESKLK